MNTHSTMHPMHTAICGASAVVAWFVGAHFVDSRPAAASVACGFNKPSNAAA